MHKRVALTKYGVLTWILQEEMHQGSKNRPHQKKTKKGGKGVKRDLDKNNLGTFKTGPLCWRTKKFYAGTKGGENYHDSANAPREARKSVQCQNVTAAVAGAGKRQRGKQGRLGGKVRLPWHWNNRRKKRKDIGDHSSQRGGRG